MKNLLFLLRMKIKMLREILSEVKEDRYWNKLYLQKDKILLYLKDNEYKKERVLWKIKEKKGQEWIEFTRWERHILYKINGRWFNYELLSMLPQWTKVVVIRQKSIFKYELNVEEILEKWTFLHFLTNGLEKQIFVPISEFRKMVK